MNDGDLIIVLPSDQVRSGIRVLHRHTDMIRRCAVALNEQDIAAALAALREMADDMGMLIALIQPLVIGEQEVIDGA